MTIGDIRFSTDSPTCLLVGQGAIFRRGLRALLEEAIAGARVFEAETAAEAQRITITEPPDLALINARLPDESSFVLCTHLIDAFPRLPVIVLSSRCRPAELSAARHAGAVALQREEASVEELLETVRRALRGEEMFTSDERQLARDWDREVGDRLGSLSHREQEVLNRIAGGEANHEIAINLEISENTVEKHVSSILGKVGIHSRTELLALLLRNGPISDDTSAAVGPVFIH